MSQSFPFKAEGVIELIAALPRAASDLVELLQELRRWQARSALAFYEHDDGSIANGPRLQTDAILAKLLSAEGGESFLRELESLSRARKVEGDDKDAPLDRVGGESAFSAQAFFGDTLSDDPSLAMGAALASLERSAEMMRDIVEDTRRDRIDFEIRRQEIDRTLARIDRIFDSRLGLSQ